jgi:phosphate transport system substrate-binding protein
LDRQAVRQVKTRRTLLRTAILAALIGGSAVAVAFVAWRQAPHIFGTVAETRDTRGEQPLPAKNVISSPDGGGAAKPVAMPGVDLPIARDSAVPAAATPDVQGSRTTFAVAGVKPMIVNAEQFAQRSIVPGLLDKPEFIPTTTTQAIAMLCHVRGSAGANSATADLVAADRRILATEVATCKRNGVMRVTEVRAGFEAVVLVRSKLYGAPRLSARSIFLALGASVPDPNRPYMLIKNPYRLWSEIDPSLAAEQIEVIGPSLSSSVVAAFRETLMDAGCASIPMIAAFKNTDPERYEKVCRSLRSDGVYRSWEDVDSHPAVDSHLSEHLDTYPNVMALLSYKNASVDGSSISLASVDGIDASAQSIGTGAYAGSRTMYLYLNSARAAYVVRPLLDFALGFERTMLDPGYGSNVPLDPDQARAEIQNLMMLRDVKL